MYENLQYVIEPKSGQVCGIKGTINGNEGGVPIDPANADYAEILRQVEAGTLVIQEAE